MPLTFKLLEITQLIERKETQFLTSIQSKIMPAIFINRQYNSMLHNVMGINLFYSKSHSKLSTTKL